MTKNIAPSPHVAFISAPDESVAGSMLDIDLAALADNYQLLASKSAGASCAAVVKADAYGTGLEQAAQALWSAGCRTFFVAHPQEGARARATLPDALIYILNGFVGDSSAVCADYYNSFALRPVLGSYEEIDLWETYCKSIGTPLPCAFHFDTGMNRLGLSPKAAHELASRWKSEPPAFIPCLIMSHLACADEPQNAINSRQLDQFRTIRACFPDVPASLSNSAGIFLGPDYHFDLVRPGIALYGGLAVNNHSNPMKPVACLKSRILSTRHVPKGWSVGYGAKEITKRESRLATLSIGYADGYLRSAGSTDEDNGAHVWIEGYEAPIIGRVSMDLIVVDVTDIPEKAAQRGHWAELFGSHIPIDDVAAAAGSIGYELLTGLGLRAHRRYL